MLSPNSHVRLTSNPSTKVTSIASTGDRELGRRDTCGVMPTRTPATLAAYRRDYRGLLLRSTAPIDADDHSRLLYLVSWFAGQDAEWAPSTIRKYRATIQAAIDDWICSGVDADEAHIAILQRALDDAHPVPRTKSAPPRTSARKRLTISESEREGLVFYLAGRPTVTCRLLVGLIGYGPILGLRPHEWVTARISGDILIVTCAKHTNGRGVASEREIDLTALSGEQRRGLDRFLARLQIEAAKCAAWQIFHERLAKALTRACHQIGIQPISLYSLRHQAAATAKRFMAPIEVAALLGHASPRTAAQHYARRAGGWKIDPGVRPTPAIAALVHQPPSTRISLPAP